MLAASRPVLTFYRTTTLLPLTLLALVFGITTPNLFARAGSFLADGVACRFSADFRLFSCGVPMTMAPTPQRGEFSGIRRPSRSLPQLATVPAAIYRRIEASSKT